MSVDYGKKYFDAYAALWVFDHNTEHFTIKKPLPCLFVSWGHQQYIPGIEYGPTMFRNLKDILRPTYTKRPRWHRMNMPVWETDHIMAQFLYRDNPNSEYLTISLHSPEFFRRLTMIDPEAAQEFAGRTTMPPLFFDVALPGADKRWFPWKAAYQECGYYLVIHGYLLDKPSESTNWDVHFTQYPVFLCKIVDFSEVGPYEKILIATEDAKRKLRGT